MIYAILYNNYYENYSKYIITNVMGILVNTLTIFVYPIMFYENINVNAIFKGFIFLILNIKKYYMLVLLFLIMSTINFYLNYSKMNINIKENNIMLILSLMQLFIFHYLYFMVFSMATMVIQRDNYG
jgi:hypothetical protein